MQEPQTWSELLGQLVPTPPARQRLASQLGVSVMTIMRWIAHTSTPRSRSVVLLLDAFPEHRETFLKLFAQDKIHFSEDEEGVAEEENIPSSHFYIQLLSVYSQIAPTLRSSALQQLILTDAIKNMAPQQYGVALALLFCLSPRENKPVQSLYVALGQATPPWPQDLELFYGLQGVESVAGMATMACHPLLIDKQSPPTHLSPSRWRSFEESAIAIPIKRGPQIAGCLLASSVYPGSMLAQYQKRLQCYADALALAIEPEQWYPQAHLQLRYMPSEETQQKAFDRFSQRVITRMTQKSLSTYLETKLQLIQEIEASFLQLPAEVKHDTSSNTFL